MWLHLFKQGTLTNCQHWAHVLTELRRLPSTEHTENHSAADEWLLNLLEKGHTAPQLSFSHTLLPARTTSVEPGQLKRFQQSLWMLSLSQSYLCYSWFVFYSWELQGLTKRGFVPCVASVQTPNLQIFLETFQISNVLNNICIYCQTEIWIICNAWKQTQTRELHLKCPIFFHGRRASFEKRFDNLTAFPSVGS